MADKPISLQKLVNADKDADTLEQVTSADKYTTIVSRLGRQYPSLAKALQTIIDAGGFKPYSTEAELKASVPVIVPSAAYAFDTKKVWLWNGSAWVDEGTSALDQAKSYADANALFNPKSLVSGFDLKGSFLKVGFYYASGTIAATLLNCPTTSSFALEVLKHYLDDYLIYRLTDRTGKIFQCVAVPVAQGGFGAWVEITANQYNLARTYVDANPLFKPVLLTSGQDLNNLTGIGYYYCAGSVASTLLNCPTANALSVENIKTNDTWFVQRVIDKDLNIWHRSYTGGGVFSPWVNVTTKQYIDAVAYIDDAISKLKQVKPVSVYKSGLKLYTTTVKNTTGQALTNALVELKIQFKESEVFSDAQIIVKDDSDNVYVSQFAPDLYFNFRKNVDQGYYKNGSFNSGSICIIDSLAVNETKHYKVYVYDDEVNPVTTAYTKTTDSGRDTYNAFGYSMNFNLNGQATNSSILRNVGIVADNTVFPCQNVPRASILTSGASATTTTNFNVNQSVKFSKFGNVFLDIVAEVGNAAQDTLAADIIKYKVIYRLFKNGRIKIMSHFYVSQQIPVNVLYACTNGLSLSAFSSGQVQSSSYRHCRFSLSSHTLDTVAMFYFGDLHRDSSSWGATRPTIGTQTISGTTADLRYGWSDTVGSSSSQLFNVKEGWVWASEIDLLIDNSVSTSTTLLNILSNTPIGFLKTNVKPYVYSKRDLITRIEKLAFGWQDWWHSADSVGFGDNANPAINNIRFARLIEMYKMLNNASSYTFNQLYAGWTDALKSLYGITDLSTIGSKYTTSTNGLKVEYLPHYFQTFLHCFYIYAVQINDTAKINEIKAITLSIANALKTYADAQGGIVSNAATSSGPGAWNMNAIGMRMFALAIFMGLDSGDGFLNTFNTLEANFTNTVRYGKILNQPSDDRSDIPAEKRYFQYFCFGIQSYVMSCVVLNRTPVFDVAAMTLNALNANGDVREMEYTCSESRRGRREQHVRMFYSLMFNRNDGEINAANKVQDAIERWLFDSNGYPYQIGEFISREDTLSTEKIRLDADTSWSLNVLGELLLLFKFNILK
ncbi:pyocin knob domain-containing protein [Acinetobacter soli]|uniref:pyocin knob domain-containing protein n=1 Tax=Acinetobacter soli TaxID=487316 RepID=UPI001D0AE720|nr:pyocin knob domain-containing protein [Acinetobacter soli]MCB8769353.1 pyocin knob domain-containing protein [Acinetobacter soli]